MVIMVVAACQIPGAQSAEQRADDVAVQPPEGQPVQPPDTQPAGTPTGAPTLAVSDGRAGEADGRLRINARLGVPVLEPFTVSYATEDGTATAGEDYQVVQGTLTFTPESTAAQWIAVRINDDKVDEDAETFLLRFSAADGATVDTVDTLAVATATIIDDDARAITTDPAALIVAEGGVASYTVVLGSQPTAPVTVTPTAESPELSVAPEELRFTPAGWRTAQTVTVTAAHDGDAVQDPTVQVANVAHGGNYEGASATPVSVTIVEDDAPTLATAASHASEGAGTMRFAVTLSLATDDVVTVRYATAAAPGAATEGLDYVSTTGDLQFPARSTAPQTIEVVVLDDTQDEPDEQFSLTLSDPVHATLAGGGDSFSAAGRIEDDDPPPRLSIHDSRLVEGAGAALRFAVTLSSASARTVTVNYATGDGTAQAEADYTAATGTLTFAAGVTLRTIAVPIADDALHEDSETFTVTLNTAVHATLEASGQTATGTIEDADLPPQLSIADATLTEGSGDGNMRFTVTLTPAAARTVAVNYATSDGTATAGSDYTSESGTLSFPAASTAQTILVPVLADDLREGDETLGVTLSGPTGAGLADATATGTIINDGGELLELASLQVTGGGSMYPEFEPDTYHYALSCSASVTLQVDAQARRASAELTLLRADESHNVTAISGTLSTTITVDDDHDVVLRLSDADGTVTYVVHCLPEEFPDLKVLTKTEDVSPGLLLVNPGVYQTLPFAAYRYIAIVDNNGVPRFHRRPSSRPHIARNFRYHANGPVVDGKRVKYTYGAAVLLDENLHKIRTVSTVSPIGSSDAHDFRFTDNGNFLFLSWHGTIRDLSDYNDSSGNPYGNSVRVTDSVIQEVTPTGTKVFQWSSWTHMKLTPDCLVFSGLDGQYAHLNSLQIVGGDIIASFKGCAQVLRIDRSSNTGAIEWKLGGTAPPKSSETEYLEIVGDDEGEFCGQHQATLTDDAHVVLFDNGNGCLGTRKAETWFTRVVEYDISSGTQASFVRQYQLDDEQGVAAFSGGVTVLDDNGHWLIAWGYRSGATVGPQELVSISEVDPDSGTAVFELNMSKSTHVVESYRAYRVSESAVDIPPNLP